MKVFKYEIRGNTVELPTGARVLTFQAQGRDVCIWAEVDPEAPPVARTFNVIGTGHDVPKDGKYIGTTQQGPFVWHLYEHSPIGRMP